MVIDHPWAGTSHCLRMVNTSTGGCECVNDQTGCLFNDGHNRCGSDRPTLGVEFDSPLRAGMTDPWKNKRKKKLDPVSETL